MRENILNLLKKGKELHQNLIQNYSGVLPENIIAGGNSTIKDELPNKINAFLTILNMNEKEEKYQSINNIDEAIILFENKNLQNSIEKTINNKDISGFSPLRNQILSSEDMLEASRFGIESGVDLLNLQIIAAQITQKK